MYLPLHNVPSSKYLIRIPTYKLCFVTVLLPLFAFVTCVAVTLYKDFENANSTHCGVSNVFPSISATVGSYEPQLTIWQSAIYMQAPLRFLIVFLRWQYYRGAVKHNFIFGVHLAVTLNIIENLALLGLTHWTSSRYYSYHEICFKTFIGTSIFYMLFICILLTKYRRKPNWTSLEKYSVKLKWRAFVVNVLAFSLAAYFFLRHNRLCEPYVYSMFGLSEYIVVISNIAFHFTTIFDLPRKYIYLKRNGITLE